MKSRNVSLIVGEEFKNIVHQLSGNEYKVLFELAYTSENNYVEVTKETKEALAAKMGEFGNTSPQSVTNTITSLAKKEIIRLVSKGSYLINSKYFGGLDASTTKLIEDIFKTKSLDEELLFTNDNPYNKPSEQLELELNDFNNLLNN